VDLPPPPPPRPRARSAGSYVWRLLLLIPAAALLACGWWNYTNVPEGGTVTAIKLTTKPGPVGQFAEAKRQVRPSNPDLYLKLHFPDGTERNTSTFKSMPVGNGLIFNLDMPVDLKTIKRVEVWDDDTFSDELIDQMSFNGEWAAEGGEFRLDLQGTRPQPPEWALPTAAVGATLCAVILLRFLWDQVV
jgi:hypothetical protein